MKFDTNDQKAKAIEAIAAFLEPLPDGDEVSWLRLEAETGISMEVEGRGRDYARVALKRIRRAKEVIPGVGFRLSAPSTALAIVGRQFGRINGAVRKAEETNKMLADRHLEQMSPPEQRQMLLVSGFFGAVRVAATQYRQQLKK
jgi:hypothetical protein